MRARGVKEAARLDLNRMKAEEWTPHRFPITAEFTQLHMAGASTLSCTPRVSIYMAETSLRLRIHRTLKFVYMVLCWSFYNEEYLDSINGGVILYNYVMYPDN